MPTTTTTTDDQLLLDWQFKFPGDPNACDGWAYHWDDYAECSTPRPTARECHATLFLICNHTNVPIRDFKDFMNAVNQNRQMNLQVQIDKNNEDDNSRSKVTLKQNNGQAVLQGDISSSGDVQHADPNVGFYARFEAKTENQWKLCRTLQASATHGYACILEHNRVEFDIDGNNNNNDDSLKLIVVTGLAPDDVDDNNKNSKYRGDIATRFTIQKNGVDVARCHLSYRDGSYDPSIGPTVEMIAVHKDYRGKKNNLLPLLWYWVKCFIEENWTLECMNTDVEPGHIMIKATQLTNATIDTKEGNDDGEQVPITDKEFFYDYAGFSVRVQKGFMGMLMGNRRPKDEEAVLYLPLLSRDEIRQRTEYKGPSNIKWEENMGARCCDYCSKLVVNNLRCTRCKHAFYCNKNCQRNDWRRHKQWCGKTKDEVHEKLVELGLRVRMPDGNYASCPRPFGT